MSTSAIFAFIPVAVLEDINFAFEAIGKGPNTFTRAVCTLDIVALSDTPPTDYAMYDASVKAEDVARYTNAKQGILPDVDVNGNDITWGVNGCITAQAVLAAFSMLSIFVNDTSTAALAFAEEKLADANKQFIPLATPGF